MGFFDFFKHPDINQGVMQYQAASGALLLDVRTSEEYAQGHIGGSRNFPLQRIGEAASRIREKDTPLFVYCLSGGRSHRAAAMLRQMGYTNVTDIGGIADYRGKVER